MNNKSQLRANPDFFNWEALGAYRVFDEFLQRFLTDEKSYITTHKNTLDLDAAFDDIRKRFVDEFDGSKSSFDEKLVKQFEGASLNTRIVFANVYFLWAMPMANMLPSTKRSYLANWLVDEETVLRGSKYFFQEPGTIANPGEYYLRHKYWEIVAILRILNLVRKSQNLSDFNEIKSEIRDLCYSAIYEGVPSADTFATKDYCAAHAALLHLSAPNKFQSIIADSHKDQICAVFSYALAPEDEQLDREEKLNLIRDRLFDSYGAEVDRDRKHRWFFYIDEVKGLWSQKKTKKEQRSASVQIQINEEESAGTREGDRREVTGFRIVRDSKIVNTAKEKVNFTCEACGFHYKKRIVQAHHLNPLCEREGASETKLDDLVCLCPNCHYLAHHLLPDDPKLKDRGHLLRQLKKIGNWNHRT
jgi:5-methylcytosine-specific restriction endonuclease McrA